MKKKLSLTLLLFLFLSCNTSKNIFYKITDSQIFFGNSGGFTNAKLEFVLNDDGNIFKIEKDSILFIKKIKHNQLKKIEHSITECGFRNIKLNSPGNMSYFIKVKTNEFENKVVWSDMTVNSQQKNIYIMLFDTIKD